jgi:uncharacterized glyoxalase superfamily protein PhnB
VQPIPDGSHTVTPYLVAEGIPKLIDFLKQAFGAQELARMAGPDGGVMHAEVKIGNSTMRQLLGDRNPCRRRFARGDGEAFRGYDGPALGDLR